jgi:predicted lipoprotein with Yx(FWY)xxD motif
MDVRKEHEYESLIGIAVLFTVASAIAAPSHVMDGRLVDEHRMTLYVCRAQGAPDAKSCEGGCARNLPPALASSDDKASGSLELVDSGNGDRQEPTEVSPVSRRDG